MANRSPLLTTRAATRAVDRKVWLPPRAALGTDGSDLITFFCAILRGDYKFLGERRPIALRDRMDAARWLADRAWGRPPQPVTVADIQLEECEQQMAELRTRTVDFTLQEKEALKAILMARRERYLPQQRAEAEAVMRSYLPDQPDGDEPK